MPASRTCGNCGATLPGSVRWCGRCYEPVREFTPRAPLHRGDFVDVLRPEPVTTRRGGTETSFGLPGRIVITVAVASVMLGVIAFTVAADLLFLYPTAVIPGALVSAWILRETWRAVPVNEPRYHPPVRTGDIGRALRPTLPTSSAGRIAVMAVAVAVVGGGSVVSMLLSDDAQAGVAMTVGLLGTGLLAAWALRRDDR